MSAKNGPPPPDKTAGAVRLGTALLMFSSVFMAEYSKLSFHIVSVVSAYDSQSLALVSCSYIPIGTSLS